MEQGHVEGTSSDAGRIRQRGTLASKRCGMGIAVAATKEKSHEKLKSLAPLNQVAGSSVMREVRL